MKVKLSVIVAGLLVCSSWCIHKGPGIKRAEWLMGTWENKTPRGSLYEHWTKVNDHELSGKSYMVNDRDTMVFETVRLLEEQDSLFYIPVVKNQNRGLPVRFGLKACSDTKMVFENTQHDFPQQISYTRINADSLVAIISGLKNGKERKVEFPMRRVK